MTSTKGSKLLVKRASNEIYLVQARYIMYRQPVSSYFTVAGSWILGCGSESICEREREERERGIQHKKARES